MGERGALELETGAACQALSTRSRAGSALSKLGIDESA